MFTETRLRRFSLPMDDKEKRQLQSIDLFDDSTG